MELRGRTALLTGAAGALGGHIARALAAEGTAIVLSDLPGERLERRADELRGAATQIEAVPADLSDRGARASLVERAEATAGPIDLLVSNAGIEITAPLTGFTDEEIDRVLEVNLLAAVDLTRRVLPGMLERGRGHVVSIASLAGKLSPAWMAPYAISKAGLIAMTEALRAEHSDDPVGFSVICPGFVAGEGMIEPIHEAGTKLPSVVRPSPPELVGKAVVRATRDDLPEIVIAHRQPMRLILAMYALAPRFTERLLLRTGGPHVFRTTTEHRGRM